MERCCLRTVTQKWLEYAQKDLEAARKLVSSRQLTGLAAFHAQQAVEKAFKAVLEEFDLGLVKTHDIERLYALIDPQLQVDTDALQALNSVYIEVRYPADLGIAYGAEPNQEDARNFIAFAEEVLKKTRNLLGNRPRRETHH